MATITLTTTRSSSIQRPPEMSDVRGLVDALVADLQASPLFAAHTDGITQWQTGMNGHDLTTQQGRERASSALGFMIHRIIRPMLVANRTNNALAMQLGRFDQRCMRILEITCPDATARTELMESYLAKARKGAVDKEKKEKVIQAYAQLKKKLDEMTQLNRDALREVFEELKAQLLVLNEEQTNMLEATRTQLAELAQQMVTLSERFSTHAGTAVRLGENLAAYKEDLSKNLKAMQEIALRATK